MSKYPKPCRACGQSIVRKCKSCPYCGSKNFDSIFAKWWFWAIVFVLFTTIGISRFDVDNEKNSSNLANQTMLAASSTEETIAEENVTKETVSVKTEYYVGDVLEYENTRIVYMSSGDYLEGNEFMQPTAGKKYIYLQFAFENTSSSSDTHISSFNFECYADGYAAEMYYGGSDDLSATLSAGRATTGYIYFEVPQNARVIEVEYEPNFITEKKIKFIYEGNRNSGYTQKSNTTSAENVYSVGDVVESTYLKISYLSCKEYVSDNMFVVPAEGYRFISCEFEFENLGTSDEYITSMDFDCYADGINCKGTYIRDDDLSATLSSGRKSKGTVTFEVPINATTIEVEYLSNYWTSKRVVFKAK